MNESKICIELRLQIKKEIPGLKLWRNHVERYRNRNGIWSVAGLAKGSSDLIGIYAPRGIFIAIEVKKHNEYARVQKMLEGKIKMSQHISDQWQFLKCIQNNGGIGCFASDVEHVKESIYLWETKN